MTPSLIERLEPVTTDAGRTEPVAFITKAGLENWLKGNGPENHVLLRTEGDLRIALYTRPPAVNAAITSAEMLKGTAYDMDKPFVRGPFPPEVRMIPARDGIEAQYGLNDVFPGDPYPAPAMGSSEWYSGPGRRVTASDAWEIVQSWLAQYEQEEKVFSRYRDDVILDGVMSAGLRRDLSALLNHGRMPPLRSSSAKGSAQP